MYIAVYLVHIHKLMVQDNLLTASRSIRKSDCHEKSSQTVRKDKQYYSDT